MRILIDESLPRRLARLLVGHEVRTVTQMGWRATKNGPLLKLAAQQFDVFLTADQNIEYQQSLVGLPLSVVVLAAPTNRVESLQPLVPKLLEILPNVKPAQFVRLEA